MNRARDATGPNLDTYVAAALAWFISEHALRNHLTSVYSKLGVANRLALFAYAHRHGLREMFGPGTSS